MLSLESHRKDIDSAFSNQCSAKNHPGRRSTSDVEAPLPTMDNRQTVDAEERFERFLESHECPEIATVRAVSHFLVHRLPSDLPNDLIELFHARAQLEPIRLRIGQ
jgi:hypothetical protein